MLIKKIKAYILKHKNMILHAEITPTFSMFYVNKLSYPKFLLNRQIPAVSVDRHNLRSSMISHQKYFDT